MLRYIGRRLLQMIPVFFGATLLLYALVFLMPGDPVAALGGDRGLTEAARARISAEYNLDKPFLVQYLLYIKGIFQLDFGTTFSGRPVAEAMAHAFPVTIKLAVMALIFEAVFGVIFGVIAGMRRGGIFDSTVLVLSLLVIAVPSFVIGFVFQFFVGVKWGLLPVTVGSNVSVKSLLMPAIVLGALSFAYVVRLTRQSVSENLTADYVRTARAKGLKGSTVTMRHVLRNSLIPVATYLGADLGALMAGAIVTEGIFGINGVGGTMYHAILKGEPTTVVSFTTVLVIVYIIANLVVDLIYALLDPRIRYA
ncbi:putative peptide transport system membrane protein [Corynebacterium diphtheriae HC01]|uniref:Peptide transport system membrane protein n=4 Tax=Corynebacterium diphtheriae TaxID=1717 RepID=Q6NI22_CORDI|nr:ABC transporter permease [Corynebacterium diphtheriae]ERA56505.1 putative peptide transport system membrane protein [Corynebacterium diphtheriae DSM 43988]OWN35728.1 ABC transporter permease [Corynebacterium belfantii]AEX43930.1 putative peptide transport system membrane protein [Corynebacterium diphtheriae 241]AEX48448.1 putative peptide transport system membrane protein [Corynebacterium diphtheriae BH8]AEX67069.1 putative peptide transport system membrane protein [Corynebacterium diphther